MDENDILTKKNEELKKQSPPASDSNITGSSGYQSYLRAIRGLLEGY